MARMVISQPQTASANPVWAKDYLSREHILGPFRLDPAQFPREASTVVTLTAQAAVNATTLTVAALGARVPAGTTLRFNTGQVAYVTADAAAAATAITVSAVEYLIPSGANAEYRASGRAYVRNGTVVGRTFTEANAGTGFGPVADGDVGGAGEAYPLVHDVDDVIDSADFTGYRPGSVIDITHFPGWSGLSAAVQAYIRARYVCINGAD